MAGAILLAIPLQVSIKLVIQKKLKKKDFVIARVVQIQLKKMKLKNQNQNANVNP